MLGSDGDETAWVRVHTGPERASVHALFGPRLAEALAPGVQAQLVPSTGTGANLDALLAHPNDAAFVQFGLFRERLVNDAEAAAKLEFYGDVPVCVLLVARAASPWMLPPAELPDELRVESIDLGASGGDTAASLAELVASATRLRGVRTEHRGGARAIARVHRRDTQVAALVEFPSARAPIIEAVLANDALDFVGTIASVLAGARYETDLIFVPTELRIEAGGWFRAERTIRTMCTSLGVAVNVDGDPAVIDRIVHAVLAGALLAPRNDWTSGSIAKAWEEIRAKASEWRDEIAGRL